jgi:hypothetical protein
VAEDAICVEEIDEPPLAVLEVFVHALDLFFVDDSLLVLVAFLVPDAPLGLFLLLVS